MVTDDEVVIIEDEPAVEEPKPKKRRASKAKDAAGEEPKPKKPRKKKVRPLPATAGKLACRHLNVLASTLINLDAPR